MEASNVDPDSAPDTKASSSSRKTISLDKKTASSSTTTNKKASTATASSVVTSTEKTAIKKPKKNKVASPKVSSTIKSSATQQPITRFNQEQRHQLIATAAYLRAEKRGFMGGDPIEDWLQAESEIDATL